MSNTVYHKLLILQTPRKEKFRKSQINENLNEKTQKGKFKFKH
jgi:hypothetical protein